MSRLLTLAPDDAARLSARLGRDDPAIDDLLAIAWRMGATRMHNAALGRRTCRICGCTNDRACPPTCSWVEADLCSACDVGGHA